MGLRTRTRLAALVVLCVAGGHATARADLSACGQIELPVEAECTLHAPSATCETRCTPVAIRASCSARLAARCEAECDELPQVSCAGTCQANCRGDCRLEPGRFDCKTECQADCDDRCEISCTSRRDRTSCVASCRGSCGVSCDHECDVELPRADCDAICEASCEGSCRVETNLDCQLRCQSDSYARCEADVRGGCRTRCTGREGALFCEGNFVDTEDQVDACIDALENTLSAHVFIEGGSSCRNGRCKADGEARLTCSAARVGTQQGALPGLFLFALSVLFALRRRRA